jgi:hypothetical protein
MSLEDRRIEDLAGAYGVGAHTLRALLATLRNQIGAGDFYVFWTSGKASRAPSARNARTLLAFPTPDAALAFAQRNRLNAADLPRVRRLSLVQLVQAVLREPGITALVFVAEQDDPAPPPGRLPPGQRIEREDILRALRDSSIPNFGPD